MESLFLLIPVALVFCAIAIKLLLWAIDSGQYDDLDKESWRILNDEDSAAPGGPPVSRSDMTGDGAGTADAATAKEDRRGSYPDETR